MHLDEYHITTVTKHNQKKKTIWHHFFDADKLKFILQIYKVIFS